ncbi:hypothetical protein T484DRAFT_1610215, partial [Baffinella frigidus]
IANHKPQTTNPKPQTTNHKPQAPNPKPQTPSPKPQTPDPKPQTPNPKTQTPNPKPQTGGHEARADAEPESHDREFGVTTRTWKGRGVASHVGPHSHLVPRNEALRSEIPTNDLAWTAGGHEAGSDAESESHDREAQG